MAKENKRSITYSGFESTKKKAAAKAKKEGRTFSQVVELLLQTYNRAPIWKLVIDGEPTPIFPLPTEAIDKY